MDEELAQWVRKVEGNVEQAVGHSHKVVMVAEGIAEQEFFRAHQEAGAAQHSGRQIGMIEGAAQMEMNALTRLQRSSARNYTKLRPPMPKGVRLRPRQIHCFISG